MKILDNESSGVPNRLVERPSNGFSEIGLVVLMFISGLVFSMVLGWIIFPNLLYSKKQQPFNFNHALHLEEVASGCESCHFFFEDGSFSGIPDNEQCIECHCEAIGESENEQIFVEKYIDKGREVPWFVYSKQPDCVFFSHIAHTSGKSKISCSVCHGNMKNSNNLECYEYNVVTGYSRKIWGKSIFGLRKNSWDSMKMNDCANCHKKYGDLHISSVQTGRDACFVCHK